MLLGALPAAGRASTPCVTGTPFRNDAIPIQSGVPKANMPAKVEGKDVPYRCRILLAEDEVPLRNLIQLSLETTGHTVHPVSDGLEALDKFSQTTVDLVILDIMMPRLDGFRVCESIRRRSDVPIVMLTALGSVDDVVHGFELGADDYITKPFAFKEVEARIQAILRRIDRARNPTATQIIEIGDVMVDANTHQVTVRGRAIHLTPIEFQLLYYLMSRVGQPISKEQLFHEVWGYDVIGGTNLVEVGVRRLREKIEPDPSDPIFLITVRGRGYKFISPGGLA
jgi:DNA-binding response OmpR family regulator